MQFREYSFRSDTVMHGQMVDISADHQISSGVPMTFPGV